MIYKLRKNTEFRLVYRRGKSYANKLLVLYVFNNKKNINEENELYKKEITIGEINLLLFDEIKEPIKVDVKTRYSSKVAKAMIIQNGDCIKIEFDEPQRALTPGQSAVFYIDDIVVGGGKIL